MQVVRKWGWLSDSPLFWCRSKVVGSFEILGGWATIHEAARRVASRFEVVGYDSYMKNCHNFVLDMGKEMGIDLAVNCLATVFP